MLSEKDTRLSNLFTVKGGTNLYNSPINVLNILYMFYFLYNLFPSFIKNHMHIYNLYPCLYIIVIKLLKKLNYSLLSCLPVSSATDTFTYRD